MGAGGRRRGLGTLVVALAVLAAACGRPTPAPAPPASPVSATTTSSCASSPPDALTARVFQRTNADRAANGANPLRWDGHLYCMARDWSMHMAAINTMVHQDLVSAIHSPAYSSYRTLGENILHGPGEMTGDQMQDAWMASPGHRANILAGSYTSFAVATAIAPDGALYAAAEFGG
jgi:uncharacterized protein YkwD